MTVVSLAHNKSLKPTFPAANARFKTVNHIRAENAA